MMYVFFQEGVLEQIGEEEIKFVFVVDGSEADGNDRKWERFFFISSKYA